MAQEERKARELEAAARDSELAASRAEAAQFRQFFENSSTEAEGARIKYVGQSQSCMVELQAAVAELTSARVEAEALRQKQATANEALANLRVRVQLLGRF